LKQRNKKRQFWWKFGLTISSIYLMYCVVNKNIINHDVRQQLAKQQIPYTEYFTTPAPLQNWLWYIVAGNDSNYFVGYRSVFDKAKDLSLQKFIRNTSYIDSLRNRRDVQQLVRFSQGFYTIEKKQDTLIFNDLRFGQIIGWQNPHEGFAFHYYLYPPIDNTLVVQRGRFAKWNWQAVESMFNRIKGN
jgi:inner membrane protein